MEGSELSLSNSPDGGGVRLEALVWRAAACHPEEVALERPPALGEAEVHRASLTYRELALSAQRSARGISSLLAEVEAEEPVVVLALARDQLDAYVALLATLSAGAAYLALDESLPLERALVMIEDAYPALMICDPERREAWRSHLSTLERPPTISTLTELQADHVDAPERSTARALLRSTELSAASLAYLIYTSGSTGRPKGVMIEHQNVTPLLLDDLEVFDLGPGDRVLQGSSHAYDSSVEEMFMAWSAGATVLIGSDATMRLGPDLGPWLSRERVSLIAPPPTLLRVIGGDEALKDLSALRYVYVGGEALPSDLARRWSSHVTLVNGYGPTECSVTVTRAWCSPDDPEVTIGHPHPGARVYVADETLSEVPFGEPGELLIGGPALARGYLRRPELTEERFPVHPVWGRVYRTGDLVSQRADGALRFHGRIDAQVKLRGYRLELSEVEVHFSALSGVSDVACIISGEGAQKRLVAFYVSDGSLAGRALDLSPLRAQLPLYMLPSQSVELPALPRLMSGKVDRKALARHPALDRSEAQLSGEDARAQLQRCISDLKGHCSTLEGLSEGLSERIAALIGLVIGEPPPEVSADFFALGGDSISAAALISHLREVPALASLTVRDVYQERSAEGLARRVACVQDEAQGGSRAEPIKALPSGSSVRLWWCGLAQALWLTMSMGVKLALTGSLYYLCAPLLTSSTMTLLMGLSALWLIAPLAPLLWLAPSALFTRLVKGALIGRYEPGEAPVWGGRYLRHWLTLRAAQLIPWSHVSGSPLQLWALRRLGAQIGEGVYLHRGVDLSHGGWELIELGDHVTMGRDASLSPVEYERHWMRWGQVRVGAEASVGIRGSLSAGSALGARSWLTDHGALHQGVEIPADTQVSGARAERREALSRGPIGGRIGLSEREYAWRFHRAQAVTTWLMSLPALLVALSVIGLLTSGTAEVSALLLSPLQTLGDLTQLSAPQLTALALSVGVISLELIAWLELIPAFIPTSSAREGLINALSHLEPSALGYFGVWTLAVLLFNVALVCALKWLLLGKVKAGLHPLWSCWCSRWDFVYVCWGELARPALSLLEGSPLMNGALRCFGVQVGARVFLGRGFAQVVDPDMLRFEDDTTVVNLFQAHSFEDRVLKTAPVCFRSGSSVGAGAVVLYGAEVGADAVVRERSVVMKGERLNQGVVYEGAPSRPC